MPIEEHKVVVEQELMQKVIVQVLTNQKLILATCHLEGIDDIIDNAIEATDELISELED